MFMPIAPSVRQRSLDLQRKAVNEVIHGYKTQRTSSDCGPSPAQHMYTTFSKTRGTLQKRSQEICPSVYSLLSPQDSSKQFQTRGHTDSLSISVDHKTKGTATSMRAEGSQQGDREMVLRVVGLWCTHVQKCLKTNLIF